MRRSNTRRAGAVPPTAPWVESRPIATVATHEHHGGDERRAAAESVAEVSEQRGVDRADENPTAKVENERSALRGAVGQEGA